MAIAPHSPRASTHKAARPSPEATENQPGAVANQAEGRLLECQAVQGLCQLLEHHVAVLEQSQEPVGSLLQSDAAQAGKQIMNKDALLPMVLVIMSSACATISSEHCQDQAQHVCSQRNGYNTTRMIYLIPLLGCHQGRALFLV